MSQAVTYLPVGDPTYPPGRLNKQNALAVGNQPDFATPWLPFNAGDAIRLEVNRARLEVDAVLQARTGAIVQEVKVLPIEIAATVVAETKFGGQPDKSAVPIEWFKDLSQTRLLKNIPGGYIRLRIDCVTPEGMREDSVRLFVNISRLNGR